jgi:membrane protein
MVALVGLVANLQTITKELTKLVSSIGPPSAAQTFKEPIASLAHGSSAPASC